MNTSNCSSKQNSWCVGDLEANGAGGLKGLKLHRSLRTECYKMFRKFQMGKFKRLEKLEFKLYKYKSVSERVCQAS